MNMHALSSMYMYYYITDKWSSNNNNIMDYLYLYSYLDWIIKVVWAPPPKKNKSFTIETCFQFFFMRLLYMFNATFYEQIHLRRRFHQTYTIHTKSIYINNCYKAKVFELCDIKNRNVRINTFLSKLIGWYKVYT